MLEPAIIIKIAKKRGLGGVAITDHNTIKGSLQAGKINDKGNFHIIPGAEIRTEYGDLIGLYLHEEIKSRHFDEVVEEIKKQGGIAILPHPYRKGKTIPLKLIENIDAIEVLNSRSSRKSNGDSLALAISQNKAFSAGSDAHVAFEIGKSFIEVNEIDPESILNNHTFEGSETNYLLSHGLSRIVEIYKSKCRGESYEGSLYNTL